MVSGKHIRRGNQGFLTMSHSGRVRTCTNTEMDHPEQVDHSRYIFEGGYHKGFHEEQAVRQSAAVGPWRSFFHMLEALRSQGWECPISLEHLHIPERLCAVGGRLFLDLDGSL